MNELILNMKNKIKEKAKIAGIASDETNLAKSLVLNKCKDKTLFVCEGLWASDKLISKSFEVEKFYICSERLESIEDILELEKIYRLVNYSKTTYLISKKTCEKISDRDGADEYFIVAKSKTYTLDDISKLIIGKSEVMAIITDGLEQPGNIGAILRSFDAAGGDFAVVTNAQAKLNSSRLIRASLGASFMLPVLEAEISDLQNWLIKNNFKCIVTDLSSNTSYRDVDYSGRIAIVSGNEHTGISDSWRKLSNAERVIIPMMGSCESLNVGFASTLVAYEAGLQKHNK